MTAAVIAILSITVLGIPFVLLLDRNAPPLRVLGLSFLYGSGLVYLTLLVFALLRVRWSLVVVVAGLQGCWVAGWVWLRNRATAQPRNPETQQPRNPATWLFDAATLLTLAGYTSFATLAPLWEWDFWAIWGLKARVFLESGAIDWRFLESRWNSFVHPDYPLLVPLNYDFVALLGGGWSDRWLGLLGVAWAVALLLVARELAERETTPLVASIITFAIASAAVSRYIGLAEGALIAFGAAGVLFVRRAILFDDRAAWTHGAICLGFAMCCKNEGLAMFASVVVAVLVTSKPRNLATKLWPALAIVAPWLLLRLVHNVPSDMAQGALMARLLARVEHPLFIVRALAQHLYEPLFWIVVLLVVLVLPAAARRREAFVLAFTAIQGAVYVAAYFETPRDPLWHIVTSWPRLTGQIAVPITFALIVVLANSLRGEEDSPHAEARPQQ